MPGDTLAVPGKTNRKTFWASFTRGLKDWRQIFSIWVECGGNKDSQELTAASQSAIHQQIAKIPIENARELSHR